MKVQGWVSTNKLRSEERFEVEIADEDLEDLTEDQRNAYIDECVHEEMGNYMSWGWNPL